MSAPTTEAHDWTPEYRPPPDPLGHPLGRPDGLLLARAPRGVWSLGNRAWAVYPLAQDWHLAADSRRAQPRAGPRCSVTVAVVLVGQLTRRLPFRGLGGRPLPRDFLLDLAH